MNQGKKLKKKSLKANASINVSNESKANVPMNVPKKKKTKSLKANAPINEPKMPVPINVPKVPELNVKVPKPKPKAPVPKYIVHREVTNKTMRRKKMNLRGIIDDMMREKPTQNNFEDLYKLEGFELYRDQYKKEKRF